MSSKEKVMQQIASVVLDVEHLKETQKVMLSVTQNDEERAMVKEHIRNVANLKGWTIDED